jgi:tRNA(Ile)-lysidine synthetase-like protein
MSGSPISDRSRPALAALLAAGGGTPRVPSLRDGAVKRIVRAWRVLTSGGGVGGGGGGGAGGVGGEPVVVACSGGADSAALVLALAAATREIIVGHVVHDLRPAPEAEADRDAVRRLAEGLGLGFAEARVEVRGMAGNAEANARRARYAALAAMARVRGIGFVATAHQGDDQLETLLMRVLRGSGPGGLRGIARRRRIDAAEPVVRVIRPMLGVSAAEARRVCGVCGHAWREDATNQDRGRLRNRLRHEVLPSLKAIEPRAGERAVRLGRVMGEVSAWIEAEAAEVLARGAAEQGASGAADPGAGGWAWSAAELAARPAVVVGAVLRGAWRAAAGARGDRLDRRMTDAVVRAVRRGHSGQRTAHSETPESGQRNAARARRDAAGAGMDRRWDWPGGVRVELRGGRLVLAKR